MAPERHAGRPEKKTMIKRRQATSTSELSSEPPNPRELLRKPKPARSHPSMASDEAVAEACKSPSPILEQSESLRTENKAGKETLDHRKPGQRSEPATTAGLVAQDQTTEHNTSQLNADKPTDEEIEAYAREAFGKAHEKDPEVAAPRTSPATPVHTALDPSRASPLTEKNGTLTKGGSSRGLEAIDCISRTATPLQNPDLDDHWQDETYPSGPFIPVATMKPDSTNTVKNSNTGNMPQVSAQKPLLSNTTSASEGSRAKANISFIVIHSRARWRARKWFPKGKFLRKTLDELMEELPVGFASNAPGLMFRVIGSGLVTEQPIAHGDSFRFDMMTNNFGVQMDEAIRKHEGDSLSFEIEIESLRHDYIDEADDTLLKPDVRDLC